MRDRPHRAVVFQWILPQDHSLDRGSVKQFRKALVALATLGAAAALGCGPRGAQALVLGAAGPWTQGYGAMNRRGIELALEEINAKGGVGGRPLQLVMRDDGGDGAKAAQIAQEFVANPAVTAVIGHVNSGAMVAAAKVYDGQMAAVATTATTPDLTGISPWVFRVISSDSVNGLDLARYATRLGKRRAAILYENDAYGRGLADAFRRNFQGQLVGAYPIMDTDKQDFEPYVSYLQRRAPDLVFVATTEATGKALLRQARKGGFRADFLGGDGWTGVVGEAAAEGALVGAPFSAADNRPEAQRFVHAFEAKYPGVVPDGNAALAYDATMLLAHALSQAGPDRVAVRDWLASRTEENAPRGVTGPLRFGPDGDPVGKGFVMTRVHAGALLVEGTR